MVSIVHLIGVTLTIALLLAVISLCGILTACGTKPAEAPYDYLVLVNKQNKLPDDWESVVVLEDAQNTLPDDVELNEDNDYLATDVFKLLLRCDQALDCACVVLLNAVEVAHRGNKIIDI